jgi:hypothetical protein
MKSVYRPFLSAVAVLAAVLLADCTTVRTTYEDTGEALPKPDMVVVYDFAGKADEVKMDSGLLSKVRDQLDQTPLPEQQVELGHKVADALAVKLVQEIQAMGLPAMRAGGTAPHGNRVVMVEGQFLSISQGNRAERVVIGLGAGRSSVKLNSELYGRTREGRRMLASFMVDAAGSRKPGMAETMGVGAAGGNLAMSAAASGAGAVGSEAFGETVEADAKRGAAKLAERLGKYFEEQGWIPPGSVRPDLLP